MTARLDDPLTLPCGVTLPNRLMKSALSETLGRPDGAPSRRLETLYTRWRDGGFGLVVTGNVTVDHQHLSEPGNVAIADDRHLPELTRWADTFRPTATPLFMQINHPGRQAHSLAGRSRPVAPSALRAAVPGAVRPRALSHAEILALIARFGAAAGIAEAAGFDGVQLHAAHGYLVSQFLSPLANRREDEWGGDAARRRRFVLAIVRAMRAAVRPGFAVAVKLNSADFQRGGFSEDESREVVRALVAEGVDLIEVSGGSYESPAMMGTVAASTAAREAYFLAYARTVRDVAGTVPIAVTGGFRTRSAMADAVSSGDCAVVGLGRPACLTPDAGTALLERGLERLPSSGVRWGGARGLVGRFGDLRSLDSVVDLQWHTDQLHRLGAGKEPDPARRWWRTVASATLRMGPGALQPKRSAGRSRR